MSERDDQLLWQDIVRLTNESDYECIRSLRVALLMWLRSPESSWLRQVYRFLRSNRALLPMRRAAFPAANPGQFVFCFAANVPSAIKPILPVVREADQRGLLGGIVAPYIFPELRQFIGRVPMVTERLLLSRLSIAERVGVASEALCVLKEISRMLAGYHAPHAMRFRKNFGVALEEIVRSLQMARAFQALFEAWKPSCVISAGDFWSFPYQFVYQASSQRIPSVLIQHGVSDFCWYPFAADLYCMWGDVDVEEMKRFGAPVERLAAVGMPAMDEIFRQGETIQDEPVRKDRQPVCLILSNTHGKNFEPSVFDEYRQFFVDAVKLMPSITWKIKLHPAEDDSFYRTMGSSIFDRLVFHPRETPLPDAVADADVITTIYSTAGLEAMIMNRPLIVAPLSSRVRELATWPATGGGVYASSAADFQSYFSKLVFDQAYKSRHMERQNSFLARHFANCGHAAERVVDLLERYKYRVPSCSIEHASSGAVGAARGMSR